MFHGHEEAFWIGDGLYNLADTLIHVNTFLRYVQLTYVHICSPFPNVNVRRSRGTAFEQWFAEQIWPCVKQFVGDIKGAVKLFEAMLHLQTAENRSLQFNVEI